MFHWPGGSEATIWPSDGAGSRTCAMRSTAADVLSRRKGGCAAVRQQAAREKPEHREAFRRSLERCPE